MTGEGMKRSVGLGLSMAVACPLVLAAQGVPTDSLATHLSYFAPGAENLITVTIFTVI